MYLLVILSALTQVTSVFISRRQLLHFCRMSRMLPVGHAAVCCDADDLIRKEATGAPLVCLLLLAVWQADCSRVWLHVTEGGGVFIPMVHVFNGFLQPMAEHKIMLQHYRYHWHSSNPKSINSILKHRWYFISMVVLCVAMRVLAEMFAEKSIKPYCSRIICYV